MEFIYRLLFIIASFCTIAGCTLGPDHERPVVDDPQAFRVQPGSRADEASLADPGWWDLFQDAHLKTLIRSALIENKDLRLAVSRVREAHAQFAATRADQFPQIDGNSSIQRNQTSGASARQFGIQGGGNREGPTTNQFKATLDLSFEMDLWDKVRRATEAEIRDTNDEIRATSDRSSKGRSVFSPKKGQECQKPPTVERGIAKRIFV